MTFEELDQRFPNGFDDAEISRLSLDYRNQTAALHLNLRGNLPDSPNSDQYRGATLVLNGLHYFSIEPPDRDHLSWSGRSKITVDGLPEDPQSFPLIEHVKPTLPVGAFFCRFYVHDWNSFIHVAADDAQFSWVEDEAQQNS